MNRRAIRVAPDRAALAVRPPSQPSGLSHRRARPVKSGNRSPAKGKGTRAMAPASAARTPAILRRMGFDRSTADDVTRMVRNHLVLSDLAVGGDPDDPATLDASAVATYATQAEEATSGRIRAVRPNAGDRGVEQRFAPGACASR